MFLAAGEYLPDQPDFHNHGSGKIYNVYPKTESSYGPIASLIPSYTALPARVQGAYGALDSAANPYVFCGTASKLYKVGASTSTFTDVSGTAYMTAFSDNWNFVLFGSRVLATNFANPIQTFTLNSSTNFANLAATAPQARFMAVVRDFVMVGNTYDASNGNQPQRIWWSAINDCTNWPTPGTIAAAQVQSDYQDIPGDQGWLQGIVGNLGTADVALFFERAVWRGTYVGSPAIFNFQPAEGVRGTPAPSSLAQLGSVVFYLGQDGFYMFDGSNSVPIGAQKVDKSFWADVNQSYLYRITATVDPINKLVFWAYPGQGSTNGNCNKLIIYNWALQRWAIADADVEFIFRSLTFGYTLDGLDVLGYTLDTLPFSLDSRVWTGGSIVLSAFNSSHAMGYYTGSTLAATVETSEFQPAEMQDFSKGKRIMISAARPISDGGTPSVNIGTRNRLIDPVIFNGAIPINDSGTTPQRADGRFIRAQITHAAGDSFTHINGVELTGIATGTR